MVHRDRPTPVILSEAKEPKRLLRRGLGVALCLIALAPASLPAVQEPVRVTPAGVLVDFQDVELRLVIAALAEAGGVNVVYSELPAKRVTLRMQQPVPRESILPLLRSLAQSNGLEVKDEGDFLRLEPVESKATLGRGSDTTGAAAPTRLFVHRLKHVRAAKVAGTLQSLFTRGGAPSAQRDDPRSGTLSEAIDETQGDGLIGADAPEVKVELAPPDGSLPGQLSGEIQIVADETTNALLVRAVPADWEVIRQAVEALDLRPLQVLIEVVIAEVRRTKDSELSASARVADKRTNPSVRGTLAGATTGDLVLELLRAGSLDVRAALSLLSSQGDVRIVSRPVILAQNNQEARILVGSERPFVQVSRTLPTDAGVRDQVIQYRDVGTKLTLTPTINDEGYVNLQVVQEVSTATAEAQFDAPIISTREASTHLFIKDGRTAVLGGLIDRQQERNRSGIPILMDIPLVGGIFGSTRTATTNSELFLFLTPHIVTDDDGLDRARDSVMRQAPLLEKALKEERVSPPTSPLTP